MSRLAFLDRDGTVASAAILVAREGHDVRYWIENPEHDPATAKIGRGLVPRAASLDEVWAWRPEVVVAHETVEAADAARREGFAVVGGLAAGRDLEADRLEGASVAERYGVGVPLSMHRFTSIVAARRFVEGSPVPRWVFKGEGRDLPCSTTQVAKDREHLMAILESYGPHVESFILQEAIDGTEISTEGWYDYRVGWLAPFNSTLERKALMVGDVGPLTGSMGSLVFIWPGDHPRLVAETVMPIEPWLRQHQWVGPIDVNAILGRCSRCGLDHEPFAPHVLEFTPRLGWNAFNAFMAGYAGSIGDLFVALGRGELRELPFRHPWMGALRVLAPAAQRNAIVLAPTSRAIQLDAVWREGRYVRSSGVDDEGWTSVLHVVAAGETLDEVRREIYSRWLRRVAVPDATYRVDIGEQAQRDVADLVLHGYDVPGVEIAPLGPAPVAMVEAEPRLRYARS